MNGQEVDYDAPITLKEVQYITFPGDVKNNAIVVGFVKDGKLIPCNEYMKVRDLYNYAIALHGYVPDF